METISFKEMQIKKLEKELAKNRNEQDRIRLELGMDTREEWLYREDPHATDEEVRLTYGTPEGRELIKKESEEIKLMDQITFLKTGEDPKERARKNMLALMAEYREKHQ